MCGGKQSGSVVSRGGEKQKQRSVWQLACGKQAGAPFYWAKWGGGLAGLQTSKAPPGGAACRPAGGRLHSMERREIAQQSATASGVHAACAIRLNAVRYNSTRAEQRCWEPPQMQGRVISRRTLTWRRRQAARAHVPRRARRRRQAARPHVAGRARRRRHAAVRREARPPKGRAACGAGHGQQWGACERECPVAAMCRAVDCFGTPCTTAMQAQIKVSRSPGGPMKPGRGGPPMNGGGMPAEGSTAGQVQLERKKASSTPQYAGAEWKHATGSCPPSPSLRSASAPSTLVKQAAHPSQAHHTPGRMPGGPGGKPGRGPPGIICTQQMRRAAAALQAQFHGWEALSDERVQQQQRSRQQGAAAALAGSTCRAQAVQRAQQVHQLTPPCRCWYSMICCWMAFCCAASSNCARAGGSRRGPRLSSSPPGQQRQHA